MTIITLTLSILAVLTIMRAAQQTVPAPCRAKDRRIKPRGCNRTNRADRPN